MRTVTAVDARRNLGELLSLVSLTGEEVVIERAGRKVARLVGCRPSGGRLRRGASGKLDLRKAAGLGAEVWRGIEASAYVRAEREQWP